MSQADQLHARVLQAEQLDAQGRHDDAINELALATQAGDLLAKTRLGKRLFTGQDAPYLPREGISFIIEAGQQGHAEAAALSSVLLASGLMGACSWPLALQALAAAAAHSWMPAREQLAILLNPDGAALSDEALPAPGALQDWLQAAGRVDIERWLQPPAALAVHEDPVLRSFPSFIPASVCERLIQLSGRRLQRAEVYDPHHRRNIRASSRTNSIAQFALLDHELLHLVLQEKMARACGVQPAQMEATAVLHYAPGEEITNHYDFVDPQMVNYAEEVARNGQRIITFLIYLNDDYAEGETVFPRLGIKHKGQRGEAFYFVNCKEQEPDLRSWHAGRPPLHGSKWIVSQFVRNHAVARI
jgi:prolyl 4-hydroxylase